MPFPICKTRLRQAYVEMLTFDALIGHNDRHPYNWGVIVPLRKDRALRFAPAKQNHNGQICGKATLARVVSAFA